jgi:hypothetical protein
LLPIRFTDRIPIGRKPLLVSPLCIGIVEYPEFVLEAYDLGINFFFVTTDMHWPLYENLRKGLEMLFARGVAREDVVVAGVAYVAQPEFTFVPFKEVADNIKGLVGVDIFVSGGSYEKDLDPGGRIALYKRRAESPDEQARLASIRATASGASFHSRSAALTAINNDLVDIAFVRHNADHCLGHRSLFPCINDTHRTKVFNFASCRGCVPAGWLKGQGYDDVWDPEVEDHYRMVLSEPHVDGILCAPRGIKQLLAIQEALAKGPMSTEDMEHMMAIAYHYFHGNDGSNSDGGETVAEAEENGQ